MTPDRIPLTESEKRGRTFLAAALALIAFLMLEGVFKSAGDGFTPFVDKLMSNSLSLLVLVLAFRGSQLAMKLTKGCLLVFVAMIVVLISFVSFSFFRGRPLPSPSFENTAPFIAYLMGVSFSIWALFVSEDVKAFIQYQRDTTHQRNLRRIKGKSEQGLHDQE